MVLPKILENPEVGTRELVKSKDSDNHLKDASTRKLLIVHAWKARS